MVESRRCCRRVHRIYAAEKGRTGIASPQCSATANNDFYDTCEARPLATGIGFIQGARLHSRAELRSRAARTGRSMAARCQQPVKDSVAESSPPLVSDHRGYLSLSFHIVYAHRAVVTPLDDEPRDRHHRHSIDSHRNMQPRR